MGNAVWAVARSNIRRRLRALVVLVLVSVVAGAVVLTALAGARRTSTAVERALDASRVADVAVDIAVADRERLDRVRALPGVADVSVFEFVAVRPSDSGMTAGLDVVGVLPMDRTALRRMDRPVVRAGRMPATDRADELAVSPGLAQRLGLRLGDALTLDVHTQSELPAVFSGDAPDAAGEPLHGRVVGVVEPLEAISPHGAEEIGVVVLSHAVAEERAPVLDLTQDADAGLGAFRIVLRASLHDGTSAAPSFVDGVFGIYGDLANTTFSEARPDVFSETTDATRVEALALLALGLAAGAAAVVVLGQAASREVMAALGTGSVLQALGLRRRQAVVAAAAPVVAATALGCGLAVVVATAASRWFPRGFARSIEPSPGTSFDAVVLLPAALVLLLALVAWAGSAARRTARRPTRRSVGAAVPVIRERATASLGASMAGGRAGSVAIGALGVAGVVASVVFAGSLRDLRSTPAWYGQDWDAQVLFQGGDPAVAVREAERLSVDRRVSGLTRFERLEVGIGEERFAGISMRPYKGVAAPTLLGGRLPAADDEIALAAGAVDRLDAAEGEQVVATAGAEPANLTVVGTLAGTEPPEFAITESAADRLGASPADEGFYVRFVDGVDVGAAVDALRAQLVDVSAGAVPPRVQNLEGVEDFPFAVAAFLALLGLAAVGHVVLTGNRRRAHDLAVLTALGMTRRQRRALVGWQTSVVGVVVVVVGVPLGIALGRRAWSAVARALHVVDAPALHITSLATATAAVAAALVGLAVVGGILAARSAPAAELRAGHGHGVRGAAPPGRTPGQGGRAARSRDAAPTS